MHRFSLPKLSETVRFTPCVDVYGPRPGNAGDKSGGESRADTGNLIKSSACLAGPMPSPDHAVELQNLRFNPMELIAKRRQTGTGNLWNLLVLRIGDDIKQLLNTLTADRRNDAKLSAMSPDCIDHRGLLSNKQVPRAIDRFAVQVSWFAQTACWPC